MSSRLRTIERNIEARQYPTERRCRALYHPAREMFRAMRMPDQIPAALRQVARNARKRLRRGRLTHAAYRQIIAAMGGT